jgi:hypothetical protein
MGHYFAVLNGFAASSRRTSTAEKIKNGMAVAAESIRGWVLVTKADVEISNDPHEAIALDRFLQIPLMVSRMEAHPTIPEAKAMITAGKIGPAP